MLRVRIFLTASKAQCYKIWVLGESYRNQYFRFSEIRIWNWLKVLKWARPGSIDTPLRMCVCECLSLSKRRVQLDWLPTSSKMNNYILLLKPSLCIWTLVEHRVTRKHMSPRFFLSFFPFFPFFFFFWETKFRILSLDFSNFPDFISWRFCAQRSWLRLDLVWVPLKFPLDVVAFAQIAWRDSAPYSTHVALLSPKRNLVSSQV